jgi:hypothetical protein
VGYLGHVGLETNDRRLANLFVEKAKKKNDLLRGIKIGILNREGIGGGFVHYFGMKVETLSRSPAPPSPSPCPSPSPDSSNPSC